MAALPYMQLYVAEYLADTSHLSAAQHGAYMLLLMNYWQRGKPLPDSNDRLAIVARMTNDEWTANRDVIAEFFTIEDGAWIHGRVERDLQKVKNISQAGKVGGLASAKARKEKASNDRSTTVPTVCQPTEQNRTEQNREKTKTDPAKPSGSSPDSVDARILCESVGIFGMREESDMMRLLVMCMRGTTLTTDEAIRHMIGRWEQYQAEMPKMEWQYGSSYKFFMGGNWDKPDNWPRKESTFKPSPLAGMTFVNGGGK